MTDTTTPRTVGELLTALNTKLIAFKGKKVWSGRSASRYSFGDLHHELGNIVRDAIGEDIVRYNTWYLFSGEAHEHTKFADLTVDATSPDGFSGWTTIHSLTFNLLEGARSVLRHSDPVGAIKPAMDALRAYKRQKDAEESIEKFKLEISRLKAIARANDIERADALRELEEARAKEI